VESRIIIGEIAAGAIIVEKKGIFRGIVLIMLEGEIGIEIGTAGTAGIVGMVGEIEIEVKDRIEIERVVEEDPKTNEKKYHN